MSLSTKVTDQEFEYVREICRVPNADDRIAILVGKLDALNAAQVIAVQRDISEWQDIEYGTEKSKGGIKGTDYSTDRNRNYITYKMRERLGYPELPGTNPIDNAMGGDGMSLFGIGFPSYLGTEGDEYSR